MNGDHKAAIKSLLVAGFVVGLLVSRFFSSRKLELLKKDPTVNQYLNRLVEFFSDDSLPRAQDEFLTMVDFGVYPKDAFKILTFDGELN